MATATTSKELKKLHLGKTTMFLRYSFTEPELKEKSSDLARTIGERAEAEDSKKAAQAQFDERIKSCNAFIGRLARDINNGYEMRDINCVIEYHVPEKGRCRIVREDTGELVKERVMEAGELQEQLFKDAS